MVVLTFDIEEWFHLIDNDSTRTEKQWSKFETRIHNNVDRILSLLADKGQIATFFCLGWVAENYPDIIRKIHNEGHEIGSHSTMHRMVHELGEKKFREDTERSIMSLEDAIGVKIELYRAPGFSITPNIPWAFEVLNELGIKVDCSIFPAQHQHGGFPDLSERGPFILEYNGCRLKSFPMTYKDLGFMKLVVSGGGYFRMLPWCIIDAAIKNTAYTMTYFHPRDFDSEQPRLQELSTLRYFKTYVGLKGAYTKLTNMIDTYDCCSVRELADSVDWQDMPTHTL